MEKVASVEEAISRVEKIFPFDPYMREKTESYENIAGVITRHLKSGGTILDFGSGPCDKTAILSFLGYSCFACDDLMDEWHKIDDNRKNIAIF